jgi:hypothetical protein
VRKLIVYLSLVFVAIAVAAAYGAMHDQISYTVSPEYFTRFKFDQFHLMNDDLPERLRASIVGIYASWWLGFPIGLTGGVAGFIHHGHRSMLRVSLEAMLAAVAFTLLFGLTGLVYGWYQTSGMGHNHLDWYIPSNLASPRRFVCAGYMHNSSYLGGVLSIRFSWAYHIVRRVKSNTLTSTPTP